MFAFRVWSMPVRPFSFAAFLTETGTEPDDYDLILTGDLGVVGSSLLRELLKKLQMN